MSRSLPEAAPDRVLGALGGVMILLAVFFAVRSLLGLGARDAGLPADIPPLTIVQPAEGAAVRDPVQIRFKTPARLFPTGSGWGTEALHLHAVVNGREVMPGGGDVAAEGADRYRWTLRLGTPGAYTLRLHWAGPDHAPLARGGSAPVRIRLREGDS